MKEDLALNETGWLKLDNAAKIYPSVSKGVQPPAFRLTAMLKANIRVSALQEALRIVLPRCPYFQVHLRRGLFWYFLQRHVELPPLEPILRPTVSTVPVARRGHLLRVHARGSTIAVDFSHILTDGYGGMRFLGTLVTQYLERLGVQVKDWSPFLDPKQKPSPREWEDAHNRYFRANLPPPERLTPALHLPGPPVGKRVIIGETGVGPALDLAHSAGVSLTEYLAAVYVDSLAGISGQRQRGGGVGSEPAGNAKTGAGRQSTCGIIRLEIPVNMRRFYPSETLRNFSLYVSPEVDLTLGDYSLEAILKKMHHSMRISVDSKELARQIGRNVGAERSLLIRVMPLFVKDLLLSFMHKRLSGRAYSGILSNLGPVAVPSSVTPHIASFGFVMSPDHQTKAVCSVLSFGSTLRVTFASVVESRELERRFFSRLAGAGLTVKIWEGSL